MPTELTAGRLALEDAVPAQARGTLGELNKKGLEKLFASLAELGPDEYRQAAKRLMDLAARSTTASGGYSFGPEHMRAGPELQKIRDAYRQKVRAVLSDPSLSPRDRNDRLVQAALEHAGPLEQTGYKEALAAKNPLALQVHSGAKGKQENLRSLLAGDPLYTDQEFQPIPYPVLHSFAEGVRPHEYFAGTFGARQGLVLLKLGTAAAGYSSKRLLHAAHRLVVTGDDGPEPYDHKNPRGLPARALDPDNEGALLAHPAAGYPRDTVLTPEIMQELHRKGAENILVRSPLVGGPGDGGVYGKDVGVREKGVIAPRGDYVGIAASQALCLAAGTLVRMADGSVKPIEAVQVGDTVFGCDMAGKLCPVKVLNTYANGPRECRSFVFRRGTGQSTRENLLEVVATEDHKIYGEVLHRTGKNRSSGRDGAGIGIYPLGTDPGRGNAFCARMSTTFDDTGLRHEPLAMAAGLLIGDGCYTGNVGGAGGGVAFSCYDDSLTADTEAYLATVGLGLARMALGEFRIKDLDTFNVKTAEDGTRYRNRLMLWLKRENMWGAYSHEKRLPTSVHEWDNTSVSALIAGLVATDGCVTSSAFVGLGSTSRELLVQVRELLDLRFGIRASAIVSSTKKKADGGTYRPGYTFVICARPDVERFAAVCTVPGVKGPRLRELLAAKTVRFSNVAGRCRLMSQEAVGVRETYDIHVDHPTHLFLLANGLIVSNSEPITQNVISSKHSGGVAGQTKGQQGVPVLDRLISIPETFPGGATHAQLDGHVGSVVDAPQGGRYVHVNGERHYVRPDLELKVKPGDEVEAGDVLTDGIPNPAEFVKHKGIGEGARRFLETFTEAAQGAGFRPHRRNLELVTRGLINHVRLDQPTDRYSAGEILPYAAVEADYRPRDGHQTLEPKAAVGQYLERPVLHYSVGTRVTPSVAKQLGAYGVEQVAAHPEPPPFSPVMVRSHETSNVDQDWLVRGLGIGVEKTLLRGVHRGDYADLGGTSYVPALAEGVGFGQPGKKTTGYDAGILTPRAPKPPPAPRAQ